ncbi:MAG: hypothetical protein HFI11_05695 [Lachnospiraceae bacterium]|jgi:flagellar hook-associated protein 3 FlgL|nr:hypothetical protein [Lachnospiraceae bacterium]
MRITNKIIQNNSLSNINLAKVAEDNKASQVSSGKKIVRPSDDPIVAIRSLRLRSSVVELTQYYTRNAKDAEAWMKTTDDALQQVADVITDMIKQYDKGANEYLTSSDRNIILEQLKALQGEVYATGDADYAGRYIFTGYRTESSLMFKEDTDKVYQITEQFTASDLKTNMYVNTSYQDAAGNWHDLANLQEGTQTDYADVEEKLIDKSEYHRLRLSYKDCEEGVIPALEYMDKNGKTVRIDKNGKTEDGVVVAGAGGIREAKSTDVPSPYMNVGDDDVIYLSDTGELLLGKNVYKELSGLVDDPLTNSVNEGEIRVTYQKSDFKEGDLKPEHYFYCVASGDDGKLGITPDNPKPAAGSPEAAEAADNIVYNPTYLTNNAARQVIEYDVGYNQRIQVNTIAEEAFNPSVTREVDDMIQALERLQKIEGITTTLKGMLDKESDPAKQKVIQDQLDAANKAFTYEKEVVQKKFSSGLTVMQGFLNEVNVAVTGCGARGSRLDLVSNRLSSQKSTFEILKSENEDVDLSEAVVQLTSAENTYEAALKATGKVMQVNLMDFI